MSEKKYKAKREMLEQLKKVMGEMGADTAMGGMGVKVEAKDKEGLMEGLDKAKEVVEDAPDMEEVQEDVEDSEEEYEDAEESTDYDEMSREELIAMLKE